MDRFAWIIWLGGGILGWVAGDMILHDRSVAGWLAGAAGALDLLPWVLAVALAGLGWWLARRRPSAGA
jgi:predicted tellurium resistance membrane protein TerC